MQRDKTLKPEMGVRVQGTLKYANLVLLNLRHP